MVKKTFSIFLVLIFILSPVSIFGREYRKYQVTINGFHASDLYPEIMIINNTIYMPATLLEEFGYETVYDSKSGTMEARHIVGPNVIKIQAGNIIANVNGKNIEMKSAPFISYDKLYFQAKFLEEALGMTLKWQENTLYINEYPDDLLPGKKEINKNDEIVYRDTVVEWRAMSELFYSQYENALIYDFDSASELHKERIQLLGNKISTIKPPSEYTAEIQKIILYKINNDNKLFEYMEKYGDEIYEISEDKRSLVFDHNFSKELNRINRGTLYCQAYLDRFISRLDTFYDIDGSFEIPSTGVFDKKYSYKGDFKEAELKAYYLNYYRSALKHLQKSSKDYESYLYEISEEGDFNPDVYHFAYSTRDSYRAGNNLTMLSIKHLYPTIGGTEKIEKAFEKVIMTSEEILNCDIEIILSKEKSDVEKYKKLKNNFYAACKEAEKAIEDLEKY